MVTLVIHCQHVYRLHHSNSAYMRYWGSAIRTLMGVWYKVSGSSSFQSSAARKAPVLLLGFAALFLPPLPRPFEAPRVEPDPREKDAFRLKPRFPPVETQGSGQSDQDQIPLRAMNIPHLLVKTHL